MRLFLGVDGGQSSTTALIGDETGRVLGVGVAGPCNHVHGPGGREKFVRAVSESVAGALAAGSLEQDSRFECACFGFSGGPDDKDALTREIVKAEKYSITHDALIALVGATGGEPGVVVIAGTGSIAFGRNAEGRTVRAGGWGYIFGDEGGAFDIVRQALRASLRFEEGWGPPTALRETLVQSAGARDANDLIHRFYTAEFPRARVASFAPRVEEAARAGDAVARDILSGAAQSLATIATAVRTQLFRDKEAAVISYCGGVFESAILLARFRMIMELDEANRVAAPKYGPATGALIEAYRPAGLNCAVQIPPDMPTY